MWLKRLMTKFLPRFEGLEKFRVFRYSNLSKGAFCLGRIECCRGCVARSEFSVQDPLCPSGQTGAGLGEEVPCNGLAAVHRFTHLLGVLYWSSSCISRGWLLSRI